MSANPTPYRDTCRHGKVTFIVSTPLAEPTVATEATLRSAPVVKLATFQAGVDRYEWWLLNPIED